MVSEMGQNSMTDVVNLRRLASELRKEQYKNVPDVRTILRLSRKLKIEDWTKAMIKAGNGTFTEMLDYYLIDLVNPEEI
ncbi:MAG: hypothetical protein Q8S35_01165 [bacterium]|nr:hypothetical protein [bacterium]